MGIVICVSWGRLVSLAFHESVLVSEVSDENGLAVTALPRNAGDNDNEESKSNHAKTTKKTNRQEDARMYCDVEDRRQSR